MSVNAVNIRDKGQITLPANIRKDLGLTKGDTLLVERRGRTIMLILPEDVVDPTAGIFKDRAYTRNPDVNEEKAWIRRHIAETADNYEE